MFISFLSQNKGKPSAILVIQSGGAARRGIDRGEQLFTVIRANTGLQLRQEPISEIKKRHKKATPDEAQPLWTSLYDATKSDCLHQHW